VFWDFEYVFTSLKTRVNSRGYGRTSWADNIYNVAVNIFDSSQPLTPHLPMWQHNRVVQKLWLSSPLLILIIRHCIIISMFANLHLKGLGSAEARWKSIWYQTLLFGGSESKKIPTLAALKTKCVITYKPIIIHV